MWSDFVGPHLYYSIMEKLDYNKLIFDPKTIKDLLEITIYLEDNNCKYTINEKNETISVDFPDYFNRKLKDRMDYFNKIRPNLKKFIILNNCNNKLVNYNLEINSFFANYYKKDTFKIDNNGNIYVSINDYLSYFDYSEKKIKNEFSCYTDPVYSRLYIPVKELRYSQISKLIFKSMPLGEYECNILSNLFNGLLRENQELEKEIWEKYNNLISKWKMV